MKLYMLDDYQIASYCVTCIAETKEKCINAVWKKIEKMLPEYLYVEDNQIEDKIKEITLGECIVR